MKTPQIILVVGAVAVSAALYFLPISPIAETKVVEEVAEGATVTYSILDDMNEIKNELDSATLAKISSLELGADNTDKEISSASRDSLMAIYDMLRKPTGSAYHSLKKAEVTNDVDHWTEAGERFLLNAKYLGSQNQKKSWYEQSKTCFEKAVELAPEDLDIQVDLGVCMIESAALLGTPPMAGIGMLKNVEQKDPKNIKALINLGYFAIKSGQFDKAEERFNTVLEIDENYVDAHLYLADMHEKQKKYDQAIVDLENYKSKSDDPQRVKEVEAYITELRKNI